MARRLHMAAVPRQGCCLHTPTLGLSDLPSRRSWILNASPAGNMSGNATADPLAAIRGLSLDGTYGSLLLGTFFGLILYGVSLHQAYLYFRVHHADSVWLKCYVVLLLLLDTLHSATLMITCYLKLISHYFDIPYLSKSIWPLSILTLVAGATVLLCQGFFAYRVYRVGRKSKILAVACMFGLLAELGVCVVATVKAFGTATYQEFTAYTWMLSTALGIAVVVDTVLTAVLICVLHTSRTGIKSTNSMLDTLVAYAVTTGLLTDIFNTLSFVFALAYSQNLWYTTMNVQATKVYTNSVLAALNYRRPRGSTSQPTWGTSDIINLGAVELDGVSRFPGAVTSAKRTQTDTRTTTGHDEESARGHGDVIEIKVEHEFMQR
ncbi:hypothetical protein LXA43DRAFT_1119767 [Ganoderma leucocontextum]|nr:hypothetical protein LXA43DRAFT_1119767 [Ganoderma leucocontextum]